MANKHMKRCLTLLIIRKVESISHSVMSNSLDTRLLCSWDSPGKNTGVGYHELLQGIFLTQGLNLGLPHCRQIFYFLSHQGNPFNIREMWIKTTMRYYLTLIRMAVVKKCTNNKCWKGYGKQGILLYCWWECKLIQPLWRTVWRFHQTLGAKQPYEPVIPLLGIYSEETKVEKDKCIPMFIETLFTTARTWK